MKKIILAILCILPSSLLWSQMVTLDSSFNSNGIHISNLSTMNDLFSDLIIQADQHIIAVGNNMDLERTSLLRYKPNGTYDSTMGLNGIATSPLPMLSQAAILQMNGKILVAGLDTANNFALARYLNNGLVDTNFGQQGLHTIGMSNNSMDIYSDVLLQNDGKIIALGSTDASGFFDLAIVRYDTTGTVDSSFGSNGIVIKAIQTNTTDNLAGGAIQTDGKIIAVGSSNEDVFICRLQTNGMLDSTFGQNGMVLTDVISNSPDNAQSVLLQPDGKILITGWTAINSTSPQQGFVMRYDSNGNLDNSFGVGGKTTYFVSPNSTSLSYDIALKSNQKIIVASTSIVSPLLGLDFSISQLLDDGTVDSTFGTNGHILTDIGGAHDWAAKVRIQQDGRIVLAGRTDDDGVDAICVVRYLNNLSIGTKDFTLDKNNILLYPNPISHHATMEYHLDKDEQIKLDLLDIKGSKLKTIMPSTKMKKGAHKQPISLEQFPTGNYFLVMSSPSGKAVIKIQKQ